MSMNENDKYSEHSYTNPNRTPILGETHIEDFTLAALEKLIKDSLDKVEGTDVNLPFRFLIDLGKDRDFVEVAPAELIGKTVSEEGEPPRVELALVLKKVMSPQEKMMREIAGILGLDIDKMHEWYRKAKARLEQRGEETTPDALAVEMHKIQEEEEKGYSE